MQTPEIIIIGGGFSGLLAAHLLKRQGLKYSILEARNRLGGRICTLRKNDEPPIEMGATWLGKKHHHLVELLEDLDIEIRQQHMGDKAYYEPMSISPPQLVDLPPNEEPSYRIEGGTDNIINTLVEKLDPSQIHLDEAVQSIRKIDEKLEIQTESESFKADFAISTLPPKLLVESVNFSPALPDDLVHIASQTHTWMAESIKVALVFDEPFWREPNSSGTIFSNVGPVNEMYDHSSDGHYALKGFMDNAYHSVSRDQRKQLVIGQLRRFYGDKIDEFTAYRELVWQNESYSYRNYETSVVPHQHNGHEMFRKKYLDDRLLISGSETATEFPGYMDGAVESAQRTVEQLKQLLD